MISRHFLLVLTALLATSSCDAPRDPLDQPAPDKPVEPRDASVAPASVHS
jgi:hypothetical protein